MKETERSLAVAKMTTYFALILTPFAWLASFFSMDPRFLDGPLVWVYWVVSVFTVALGFLLYHVGNKIRLDDLGLRRMMAVRKGLHDLTRKRTKAEEGMELEGVP